MKKRPLRRIKTITINNQKITSKTMLNSQKNIFLSKPLAIFSNNLRKMNLKESKP